MLMNDLYLMYSLVLSWISSEGKYVVFPGVEKNQEVEFHMLRLMLISEECKNTLASQGN